jgi:class 3 adenylate cyclase/predicted ATPase
MTFDEVLTQILALLQREKRVSYRALKRRFDLDDDYLEDVKDELIYAKKLAVDEENRVLVWTGDQETSPPPPVPSTSEPTAHPAPDHEREPLSYTPKHLAEKILTSRSALEGERKQVTVLFCDLVNSIPLAERLGSEHMHTLLNRFFELALKAVHRFEGTINQFLGDGFMALFGAPIAHEDHARRAVLAALALQRTLKEAHLGEPYGVECAFRMGLNSGLVVVGSIGDNLRMDYSAIGDTTNLASRLQDRAAPGDILISESTSRLVQGAVRLEALAPVEVKGKREPVPLYKVIGTLLRRSPIASRSERTLSPFVGREREVATLETLFAQVEAGQGQVVGIEAEAGGGKSRLLYEFRQRLQDKRVTYLEGRCLSYSSSIPYHPLIDVLRHNCGIVETDSPEAIIEKVYVALQEVGMDVEASAPYLLQLLGVKEGTEPIAILTPEAIRTRTFDTLKQMSLNGSQQRPLIFEIEDLHWLDKTSEDFLISFVESLAGASIMLLTTYRPGYRPSWIDKFYATQVSLGSLTSHDALLVMHSTRQHTLLSDHLVQTIIEKSQGNPFFLEELTRAVIEHGALQTDVTVPDTIQGMLSARMDRLPEEHKRLLQTASILGREFSQRLLYAIWESIDTLDPFLSELKRLEFLYERTGADEPIFIFKHILTQEVAYESLLTTRRQALHSAAGQALETLYADRLEDVYALLAYHYARTTKAAKAVEYLTLVAEQASRKSAYVEATAHLAEGLALIMTLPDTPERTQQELTLHIALGRALMATKGYAASEVEHVYARARALCQRVGETPRLLQVLLGLATFYFVRAELRTARELGEQCLSLAVHVHDTARLQQAHLALGSTLFHLGTFPHAREHLEQGLALYATEKLHVRTVQDPKVACLSYVSWLLWLLGYPSQALAKSHAALTLAQELSHPLSLVFALLIAATLHQLCRERQAVQERIEAAMPVATEQEFHLWLAYVGVLRGWGNIEQGQRDEGIVQIYQGIVAFRNTGAGILQSYFLALQAEAYKKTDQIREGLTVLNEALVQVDKTDERWYESEIYRLKGELLLQQHSDNQAEAASCFHHALEIARNQQAKSFELRTATSLARLWQQQGKRQEAYDLLAPVYHWFTEGFDTADLKDAKALLDELA